MIFASESELSDFEQTVAAHEVAVRAFLTVRLDDPFEAHDLAQEVFLILWRRRRELDRGIPIRAWLLGVAANLIREHRRKRRERPMAGSCKITELLDHRIDAESQADASVFVALEHCMGKLVRAARELIRCRYQDGQSVAELCQQLGKQHSAVTMKLHRLRQRLMDCITNQLEQVHG